MKYNFTEIYHGNLVIESSKMQFFSMSVKRTVENTRKG